MSETITKAERERLGKLLHLAKNAGTEGEAAAAMNRAQSILTKYNLQMAEVEAEGGQAEGGARKQERAIGKALYEYQRQLMRCIADNNFCLCFLNFRTKGRSRYGSGYTLVGREANIVSTQIMFDYLNETLERLVPITSNAQRLSKSSISWKEGAASRIRERIDERAREIKAEREREVSERQAAARHPSAAPIPPGSLVLVQEMSVNEQELNRDLFYGLEPGTSTARRLASEARWRERVALPVEIVDAAPETPEDLEKRRARERKWQERYERERRRYWEKRDINSYYAGRAAGDTISLDQQVAQGETPKRIG